MIPNPGSKEAVEQGCICAVYDNHHGEGFMLNGQQCFYYTDNCPVHSKVI